MAERSDERRRRRSREDAQQQLAAAQRRPDLATDLAEHLRLDPEEDDVGSLDRLLVVADDADAVLGPEMVTPLGARMAGDDLIGRDELAPEQAGDHRLRHHSGADRGDRSVAEWGHRAEYCTRNPVPSPTTQGLTPVARTKNRPVVETSTSVKPAARRAASISSGVR